MRRREFIVGVCSIAAWPLIARAQSAMPVVGYLSGAGQNAYSADVTAFVQGLKEQDYLAGQNVLIKPRLAEGHVDRLPALAAELVAQHVAVIFAAEGASSALAAKAATSTIPIVFVNGGDPVKLGLVQNLNRPGGNITGVSMLLNALGDKRLGLLHEVLPAATKIGLMTNPTNPSSHSDLRDIEAAARALKLHLIVENASTLSEIDRAFASLSQEGAEAFISAADIFLFAQRKHIVALAEQYKLPAIYHLGDFAAVGGLMAYGTEVADAHRLGGVYTRRILKGEEPRDLAVQQPVKTEFVVNLKTAKALGLSIPPGVLAIADKVIE